MVSRIITPEPRIDTFTALSSRWAMLFGTAQIAGGGLQGLTQGADGIELVVNGEFTTNTAGWSSAYGTLSWVNSLVNPGSQGGLDAGAAKVVSTAGAFISTITQSALPTVPGITYALSAMGHAAATNTYKNVRIEGAAGLSGNYSAIADGVWIALAMTSLATAAGDLRLRNSITLNDAAYFDKVSCQAMCAAAYDLAYRDRNPRVITSWLMPAAPSVIPAMMYFRMIDWANKWEIWITPNTAGTDFSLIERVGGVATTRASADIDWTASATDNVMLDAQGSTIRVYVMKSGAVSWTLALEYTGATTGLTATMHGWCLFGTGVTRLVRWQPVV